MKTKLTKLVSIFMVLALLLPTAALAQPSPEADVSVPAAPATQLDVYLIRLADPPLAAYKGGIAGLEATNPSITGERKLDANSPESLAYLGYLESVHGGLVSAMENTFNRSVNVVYEYFSANNGMAVELTAQEAKLVEQFPEVVFVQHDYERELHTDAGPAFIGAPGIWDGTTTGGLPGTMGEGIIIGVIDTGINPSNPSFADIGGDGYDHNNPWGSGTYVGVCDPGDPSYDPTFPCNDKLIGAWGYPTVNGGDPRDGDGHGSHTSSTAGGNFVYTATVEAPTIVITRAISGVAPHANIVAYAACCTGSALAAAIDQIVLDGVDVVNYSIGSSAPSSPWLDFDAVGYLNARDAGIFVATSAGNNGPGPNTVGSPADVPWITSVGSSLHDRAFLNVLQNMSGGATTPPADIEGKGLTVGYGPAPIVYAGDFDGIPPGDPDDGQCLTPFPAGTWTSGEIVVCDRGTIARVAKGQNVLAGGAGGLVLANMPANGEGFGTLNGDSHYLPAVHVTRADGDVLRAWLASGSGHMATISGTQYSSAYSDIMSGFSSRGGNRALPDIIVPSVTAPGTDIIAAYGIGDPSPPEWNVVSGTSMASPHVAGAGALMMALHPEWSPAEIQSALMTTAWTDLTKEDGVTPADTFDMGSGRVDLSKAGIAGLVLDETTANYWAANPDTGGDPKTLNLASMGNSDCDDICSWTRTVSSTVSTPITWTAMTDGPAGMVITVDPISFTLGAYASQVLSVEVDVTAMTPGEFAFAELSLVPDDMSVSEAHLPIAVRPRLLPPVIGVEPDSMSTTQDSGVVTTLPLTITNTGEDDLLWNIFDTALPTNAPLVDWFENFDSYATGSQIIGQGGWEGWGGDPNAGAIVTDTVSLSPDNSIEIVSTSDLVHQYADYNAGWWIYTANVYVPSTLVGQSYFILLNTYGGSNNWSTQVRFDSATGEIFNTGASGGSMSYLTDQWVEIRVEIDLEHDTQDFYYNDTLLYSGTWTDEVSGGGALNIGAVDLYANGASSVFYDDLSLVETGPALCDAVNDLPWVSASPDNGTTPNMGSSMVDVSFDSTGLGMGLYEGSLCVESNDPATPVVAVPISMTVTSDPPEMVLDADTFESTQFIDEIVTQTLTISNVGLGDLNWSIFDTALPTNAPLVDWFENFDSYATGSQIIGQGGWEGWGGDPNAGAIVTDTVSLSPDNSIDIVGATDLVHQYSGYDTGLWIYTANVYVPSTLVGQSYFILLNTYGVTNNWSTQVRFDSATGEIFNTGASGGSMPYLTDQWVEIRVEIDLGNDTQDFYYNDTLLYSGTWTEEVSGGGALNINAVDLFANGASSVFYDDLSLVEYIPGPCDVVNDLPWLTVSPDSGTTPSMGSSPVDIMFDSTGLGLGLYQGTVCIDSNDPTTPLYAIPITMTVIAEEYGVDLSGDDAMSGLPGDVVTYTLAVTNTGNVPDTFDVVVSSTWKADASVISVTLNAGQMDYFDVAVTVPAGAADGDMDTATVMVTSTTDPMAMDEALLTTTVGASYGVELSGDDAMGAAPGEVVTYTLAVTNTGNVTDTFNVVVSGTWTTTAPISVTLAPGAMTYIDVVVTVPADAAGGDMDTATVTVTSQSDPLASDMAYLTTSVTTFERYLPLIYK